MSEEELEAMRARWMNDTTQALKELKAQIEAVSHEVLRLQQLCASSTSVEKIHDRVTSIEQERAKVIGALIVVQAVGAIGIWIMNRVWK